MIQTREYAKVQLLQNYPDHAPLKGPLLVIYHFRIPAPMSIRQCKRDAQRFFPHTKRPDGDNLEKFINDSLTGLVWNDDSQIVWMLRSKTLSEGKVGETIMTVIQLPDSPPNYTDLQEYLYANLDITGASAYETA
jgi:Holliday junction resolvase RusA-like endonuclease